MAHAPFLTSRLKHHVARLVSGGTPTTGNPAYWADGTGTPWVVIGDMTGQSELSSTLKHVSEAGIRSARLEVLPPGTLLFAMYASLGTMSFLSRSATTNQAILGLVPRKSVTDIRFLWFWLHALRPDLISYARSNTQDNLNAEVVGNLPFPALPVESQRAIARFLDRATGRIDALVGKKRRLIELLEEKRTALISHVVTKGLDPTVPMKDSGIPWLGLIPTHWEVGPLRRWLVSITDGPFGSALKSSHYSESGARVVRLGNIGPGEFVDLDAAYISLDYFEDLREFAVQGGDLVIAGLGDERRTLGRACLVPEAIEPAIVKADCFRVRMSRRTMPAFLAEFLSSIPGAAGAWALARGTTRQRINTSIARDLVVPVPPIDEQRAILDSTSHSREATGLLTARINRQLAVLAEYRQALITAAVTGEIDVTREGPDPEEALG